MVLHINNISSGFPFFFQTMMDQKWQQETVEGKGCFHALSIGFSSAMALSSPIAKDES